MLVLQVTQNRHIITIGPILSKPVTLYFHIMETILLPQQLMEMIHTTYIYMGGRRAKNQEAISVSSPRLACMKQYVTANPIHRSIVRLISNITFKSFMFLL